MNQANRGNVSYEGAAAAQLRPDLRPHLARWWFGVRAGVKLGVGAALSELAYLVVNRGQPGNGPMVWEFVIFDFLLLPLVAGVYGLSLPLVRSIRAAVTVGCALGLLVSALWIGIEAGDGAIFTFGYAIGAELIVVFAVALTLGMREVMLVKWRPPR